MYRKKLSAVFSPDLMIHHDKIMANKNNRVIKEKKPKMIKVSEKTTDRGIEDINFCTVKKRY